MSNLELLYFRGWDSKAKIFLFYDDEWHHHSPQAILGWPNLILQRCTGTRDYNGHYIYEGDIIEYNGMKGEIKWEMEGFKVGEFYFGAYSSNFRYNCKIIGNIFQNPELLYEEESEDE